MGNAFVGILAAACNGFAPMRDMQGAMREAVGYGLA